MVEFADIEATRNGLGSVGPLAQSVLTGNSMTAFQSLSSEAVKCLSSARPSRPVVGQMIFETDTQLTKFWSGSAWVSGASPPTGAAGGVLAGSYPNPTLAATIAQSPKFATTNATLTIAETGGTGNASIYLTDDTAGISSEGMMMRYDSSTGNSYLRSTYPTGKLQFGCGSPSAAQIELLPDGRLVGDHFYAAGNYMADFPTGVNQAQTVSVTVPFKSALTCVGSASCYVTGAGGPHYGYMAIYGITGWSVVSKYYHNTAYDHRTYPTGSITATVNAGTYNIGWYFPTGQNTDGNDRFHLTVFAKASL